ncbi:MAG: hypothetical protein ACLUE2_22300 [Bacteroides cellulosilyticus]
MLLKEPLKKPVISGKEWNPISFALQPFNRFRQYRCLTEVRLCHALQKKRR